MTRPGAVWVDGEDSSDWHPSYGGGLVIEIAMSVGVVAFFFLLSPVVTTLLMMPKALGGVR